MTIISVFTLLGGIGMFLYGMSLLGSSLEKMAGAKLEQILEKLTNNRWKGLALGTAVTGIIQSSAATTVMLVGFVNAGIMKFAQTVPVVMGANIGSTVTGQILRLGDVSGSSLIFTLLKPSSFAPLFIALGAFMQLISKKRKTRDLASILIGFGILFVGMTTMESALSPLKDSQAFKDLFAYCSNPLLGLLLGFLVCAAIQSSSASVGILQAIASTGNVTFSMAVPIIIGMNIGKCLTVLLASFGTNKNAKRVVASHLFFNVIGALLFMIGIYSYNALIGFSFWEMPMNRGNIADFHSLFNIITCMVLIWFSGSIATLCKHIVKDEAPTRFDKELGVLDDMFLDRPIVALEQCKKVIHFMNDVAMENYTLALELLKDYDDIKFNRLQDNENHLDRTETVLSEYLVRIKPQYMRREDRRLTSELLHMTTDLERIGDHCVNIAEVGQYNHIQGITFSADGIDSISHMADAVFHILELSIEAYNTNNLTIAARVEPLEEVIDEMNDDLKEQHIERLQRGVCSIQAGISLTELTTSMERIADHCSNIALYIMKRFSTDQNFDMHSHAKDMHDSTDEAYQALKTYYRSRYACDTPMLHKSEPS